MAKQTARKLPRQIKDVPAGGLDLIREYGAKGVRDAEIARRLGMDPSTFRRLVEENEEVGRAYLDARKTEEDALVGMLFDKAINERDSVAAMFLLKTRHHYRDRGEIQERSTPNIVIQLPAAASSAEEYGKLVKVSREGEDGEGDPDGD